ncbi:alcohol dehydrogenase catalytic domain-containing protein [Marinobacter sp. M3C]|uniref:alcohol dehydrogenase catalytic domain-containing protein n=1 Tax=Marinobacter sp. M3C TaxID=2917715 RepID=UPI00201089C6|nr:alcohol dehydrogenase catalytic domain-containing protein [Marinobacter sp. M3C]UQG59333.1 alcohol dehydrogenase catalytic domain-containing protein [Marinobacter sp. M3C]
MLALDYMERDERLAPGCDVSEALLSIRRVGIFGTDIHAFGCNQPYFAYLRVKGHELAGEIAHLGDGHDQALVEQNASVIPYSALR